MLRQEKHNIIIKTPTKLEHSDRLLSFLSTKSYPRLKNDVTSILLRRSTY